MSLVACAVVCIVAFLVACVIASRVGPGVVMRRLRCLASVAVSVVHPSAHYESIVVFVMAALSMWVKEVGVSMMVECGGGAVGGLSTKKSEKNALKTEDST